MISESECPSLPGEAGAITATVTPGGTSCSVRYRDKDQAPLVLERVTRVVGLTVVLHPLTLRLDHGTICIVAGPNGSGKTTLLRIAAGAIRPTSGTRAAASPSLYMQPGDGARRAQTVWQAVNVAAKLRGSAESARDALESVGLAKKAGTRVGMLSAGERARVTLAIGLVTRPAVLCLDEPTAHVDVEGAATAAQVVTRLAEAGTAVLVATHDEEFLMHAAHARLHLRRGRLARLEAAH